MKEISQNTKSNIKGASIFILGVLVTIFFNKTFDTVIPSTPVVVREITDTIKIVHDYRLPSELNDDSIRQDLERKIRNLELLNNYDKLIRERVSQSRQSNEILPNLILTNRPSSIIRRGFKYGSSSSYFSANCPSLNEDFIDIYINFFNPIIIKEIAFLRVNIYQLKTENSVEKKHFVLEEYYDVKPQNNFIRLSNDLGSGKYEIIFGFILKRDLDEDFPTFHFKRCILTT